MSSQEHDATLIFADHIANHPYEALPTEAVRAAKIFLLDSLGVGVMGTKAPHVRAWLDGLADGSGAGRGRVLAMSDRLPTPAAAAANAFLIHNSEYDCVHEQAVLHPMAVLLGSLLPTIDELGPDLLIDGRTLLRAIILGVDVACHIGSAVNTGLKFFRPATAGGFGAVAALAILHQCSKEQLLDAWGLYYAQASGTMQAHREGLPLLAMQVGFCARSAVTAIHLAKHNIPGTRNTLEGPFGYLNLMEDGYDKNLLCGELGKIWRITEVAHKPFPSGRATHGVVDGLRQMMQEHELHGEDVAKLEVSVPPLTYRLVGRPVLEEMTVNYARLCGRYCLARVLKTGHLGPQDFDPQLIHDPDNVHLAKQISMLEDSNPDPNALSPVTLKLTQKDGQIRHKTVDVIYGNPAHAMSQEAHTQKYLDNIGLVGTQVHPEASTLVDMVQAIETQDDCRVLLDMLTPA